MACIKNSRAGFVRNNNKYLAAITLGSDSSVINFIVGQYTLKQPHEVLAFASSRLKSVAYEGYMPTTVQVQ